jgi:hypothetical protein
MAAGRVPVGRKEIWGRESLEKKKDTVQPFNSSMI